ncbi:MAG: hypothetical protein RIK87_09885, partial [Fuerstiella sp.]
LHTFLFYISIPFLIRRGGGGKRVAHARIAILQAAQRLVDQFLDRRTHGQNVPVQSFHFIEKMKAHGTCFPKNVVGQIIRLNTTMFL